MAAGPRQVKATFADAPADEPYEPHMGQRGRIVALALLLLAVTIGVYLPSLRGQFIVGEDVVITSNTVLRAGLGGLGAIWLHPTISPHYQPLAYSLLSLEFKGVSRLRGFGVDHPQGYLLVNMLLHAANVLLLWTLLRKLEVRGALMAAMLFAVHPVNVQTVAWINQQPLLLCGMFYLWALLVYLRFAQINPAPPIGPGLRLPEAPWMLYGLAVLLMGAALLNHAAAVSLPLVALVVIWWERGRLMRRDWRNILPLLALGLLWLCVALYADWRRALAVNDVVEAGPVARMLIACRAAWIYLLHFTVPWRLSFIYPKWQPIWIDALGALALVGVIIAAARSRRRVGRGPVTILLLFLTVFLPMLLLRTDFDRQTYLSDHLLYLPGIVLGTALVAWLAGLTVRKLPRWIVPAGSAVIGALALVTVTRFSDFRSSENVWSAILRRNPDSALAHNELGLIYLSNKNHANALEHFKQALRIDGSDVSTLLNIAAVYSAEDRPQDAINTYLQVLNSSPDNAEAHFGLGQVYAQRGDSTDALREYSEVLRLSADHVKALNNIGLLHSQRGETKEALESYQRAIEINPGFMPSYINLANLQYSLGQVEQASQTLNRAARIDPDNFELWINAGSMVGMLAGVDQVPRQERITLNTQAVAFFRKAWAIKPTSALANEHLGMALMQRDQLVEEKSLAEAIFYLRRAVELEPDNPKYRQNLEHAQRRQQQAGSGREVR